MLISSLVTSLKRLWRKFLDRKNPSALGSIARLRNDRAIIMEKKIDSNIDAGTEEVMPDLKAINETIRRTLNGEITQAELDEDDRAVRAMKSVASKIDVDDDEPSPNYRAINESIQQALRHARLHPAKLRS
jgi:hypothetical protein